MSARLADRAPGVPSSWVPDSPMSLWRSYGPLVTVSRVGPGSPDNPCHNCALTQAECYLPNSQRPEFCVGESGIARNGVGKSFFDATLARIMLGWLLQYAAAVLPGLPPRGKPSAVDDSEFPRGQLRFPPRLCWSRSPVPAWHGFRAPKPVTV